MNCARCKSENNIKNGVLKGVQRYKCKDCGYNFTVELKSTAKPEDIKRQALLLYLEGLGFRSIARILKVHNTTIYRWIRAYGSQLSSIRNDKLVEIMELDELHSYVGRKKTTFGFGLVLAETTDSTLISSSAAGEQKRA